MILLNRQLFSLRRTLFAVDDIKLNKLTCFGKLAARGVDNLSWQVICWSVSLMVRRAKKLIIPEM